jgi:hypothetical protein
VVPAPQIKNVANRIQNTVVLAASRSAPSAVAMIGAELRGGARSGSAPVSPKGPQADLAGMIAHHHGHHQSRQSEHPAHQSEGDPPAEVIGQISE